MLKKIVGMWNSGWQIMKNKLDEIKLIEEMDLETNFEQNQNTFCIFDKNKIIRRGIQTFKYRK